MQETLLANLGPLADLLDQYASACNEVISLFAHIILRLFETVNNIGSPFEIITSSFAFLLTLLCSILHLLVHEVSCLILWPFRTSLNLLIAYPLILTLISLISVLSCAAFIIIIKQISFRQVYSASTRFVALNFRPFICAASQYFYPSIVTVLHLLVLPVKFLCDTCISFVWMIPVFRSKRIRRYSSNCGADDVSRITCCICFIHEKSILLQPCNHICLCAHCVEELLETYEEPLCPLCRSIITSYVDVYI